MIGPNGESAAKAFCEAVARHDDLVEAVVQSEAELADLAVTARSFGAGSTLLAYRSGLSRSRVNRLLAMEGQGEPDE